MVSCNVKLTSIHGTALQRKLRDALTITLIELKLNLSVVCCPLSVVNLTRFIRRYDNTLAKDL